MTTYLLESALSLLLLLGFYQLFLENQPIHRLKRVYLLGTLGVAFVAPLLTIEVPVPQPITPPSAVALFLPAENVPGQTTVVTEVTAAPVTYWLWLYAAGTLLMLVRFARNLYQIAAQVRRYAPQPFRGVWLVPLPTDVLPHTFLRYLFVSKAALEQGTLEPELLTHELAHIRQRHSLDVLLIELVLCFGWFNPLLIWLKRAMQRNHEFLADEAVNAAFGNVPGYQHLLLTKLTRATTLPALVSTLTFQTTKQRLLMMTKHASPARTWFAGGTIALVFGIATLLVTTTASTPASSTDPVGQRGDLPAKTTDEGLDLSRLPQFPPATNRQIAEVERWFSQVMVAVPDSSAPDKWVRRKYADLTQNEKRYVVCPLPERPKAISPVYLNDYKNKAKYDPIHVDGQEVKDFAANKLTADDIAFYQLSPYGEGANEKTAVFLYTRAGFEVYKKRQEANPLVFVKVTKW
ncbi:hypothetical protein FAES_0097 [Fibrella aestuarina BUZ 2]|uniref:Peptidase M56 domain-containing protein n=1 Tax=Fibrella aestuarina BUZ 2 TaxID=1166018 RepID=I0K1V8_9BACT|nr:M56 family metallopeptidase [Fibrella aestuarina]CCG98111.1 hypothetical protein FAES_0097 [Fibrella aestuarina BUZ 2]